MASDGRQWSVAMEAFPPRLYFVSFRLAGAQDRAVETRGSLARQSSSVCEHVHLNPACRAAYVRCGIHLLHGGDHEGFGTATARPGERLSPRNFQDQVCCIADSVCNGKSQRRRCPERQFCSPGATRSFDARTLKLSHLQPLSGLTKIGASSCCWPRTYCAPPPVPLLI